MVKVTFC